MLFQEYAITPEVFSKEYFEKDPLREKDLLFFLKQIRTNGIIASINKNEWIIQVAKYRENLTPAFRDRLSKVFEYLQNHHRIVEHETIIEKDISSELDWLRIAIKEDELKPYIAILFTGSFEKPYEKTLSIEEFLDKDMMEYPRTGFEIEHSEHSFQKYLKDFLLYAKKLTIIDPYFTYNRRDDEALMLYADLFAKRRGNRLKNKQLIVHTYYNKRDKFVDPDKDEYKNIWIKIAKDIHEYYHHRVTINVWNDKIMHDRFMITNQGGISSGRGFSLRKNMRSFWSLIDADTQRRQLNHFNQNANPNIKLVFSLTHESELSENCKTLKIGKIKKIVHDNKRGKVGFLELEDGSDYYFQLPAYFHGIKDIKAGVAVEFEIKENYRGEVAFIKKVL